VLWASLQYQQVFTLNFRDAKSLGIVNFLEQYFRATFLGLEAFDGVANIIFDDVVAENYADRIVASEEFGETEGFRDSAFAFQVGVIQVLQSEVTAVPQKAQEVSGVLATSDQQDFLDSGVHKRLNGVIHHGLVVNWKKVLVGHTRQRVQATASSTCEDYASHSSVAWPDIAKFSAQPQSVIIVGSEVNRN
jgi:hypothetical protein